LKVFSGVLSQAKNSSKLSKPDVMASVTVPQMWKNVLIQRGNSFEKSGLKMRATHRRIKNT
jgi:hypothetical protein